VSGAENTKGQLTAGQLRIVSRCGLFWHMHCTRLRQHSFDTQPFSACPVQNVWIGFQNVKRYVYFYVSL